MRRTVPQRSHIGSHISRKNTVYRYRGRLPVEIGSEVTVSLSTRNYREAEHRAALLDHAFRGALRRALNVADETGNLNQILRDYLKEALAEDRAIRLGTPSGAPVVGWGDPEAEDEIDADLDMVGELRGDAQEAFARRDVRSVAPTVTDLMERRRLPDHQRRALALGVLEANVRFYKEVERRSRGVASLWLEDDAGQQEQIHDSPGASEGPRTMPGDRRNAARGEARQAQPQRALPAVSLIDGSVDVASCDMPQLAPGAMGRFILTQMAAVAELEAGLISERTTAALMAARARGVKFGGDPGAIAAVHHQMPAREPMQRRLRGPSGQCASGPLWLRPCRPYATRG